MDEYIDPFVVTSSWTNANSPLRSSWDHTVASQIDGIHHDTLGPYGTDEQKPDTCLIASDEVIGRLPIHGSNMNVPDGKSTIFGGQNPKYGISRSFFFDESQLQQNIQDLVAKATSERRISLPGKMELNLAAGSFETEHGSIGSNGSEPSAFLQSLGDSQSSSTAPPLWQPAFSSVSSLLLGQSPLQNFSLQGGFVKSSSNFMGKGCTDNEFQQLGASTRPSNEHKELHKPHLPSFTSSSEMDVTGTIDVQANHQPNNALVDQAQYTLVNSAGQNGAVKPRTRARRGQATDPHSIAERLRREKIADRMKNLQELVPNSNKTDKASMLDEITDYVKFLQLQVKVLSMSRLGAAGAVVPLITDIQSEGLSSLLLSPAVAGGGADICDTQDNLAFEQKVVKLMETNVTTAMQLLQTKGLCLMPIALAAAISGRKGSSAAIPPESMKSDTPHSALFRSSETLTKERRDRQ